MSNKYVKKMHDELRTRAESAESERDALKKQVEGVLLDIRDLLHTLDAAIPKDAHPWMSSKHKYYCSKYTILSKKASG